MELPFQPTISRDLMKRSGRFSDTVADWKTKRRWVEEAFAAFEAQGYSVKSAYTLVKDPATTRFVYTDRLWQGADMAGLGGASFGHVNKVHIQNAGTWGGYSAAIERGEVPPSRAHPPTAEERKIRELLLQLKFGAIRPGYLEEKYGVKILQRFSDQFGSLAREGYLDEAGERRVTLSRDGLLRVDSLLPRFFLPQHTGIRYT